MVQPARPSDAEQLALPGFAAVEPHATEPVPSSAGSATTLPETAFARVFRRLDFKRAMPHFHVEYRAFTGLRSTIRLRDGHARVHISDLLMAAPPIVLEALAEILLAQVFRRQPSCEARECYLAYISAPPMRRRIDEIRRRRGTKRLLPSRGRCYDLDEVFAQLNRKFFAGALHPPRLGWSPNRSRTLLGHYDAAHRTITISRWLDSPATPRYLMDYLVFHEMLHMRFPVNVRGHRRIVHSVEFRAAEKQFPKCDQARRRLKRMCGRLE